MSQLLYTAISLVLRNHLQETTASNVKYGTQCHRVDNSPLWGLLDPQSLCPTDSLSSQYYTFVICILHILVNVHGAYGEQKNGPNFLVPMFQQLILKSDMLRTHTSQPFQELDDTQTHMIVHLTEVAKKMLQSLKNNDAIKMFRSLQGRHFSYYKLSSVLHQKH